MGSVHPVEMAMWLIMAVTLMFAAWGLALLAHTEREDRRADRAHRHEMDRQAQAHQARMEVRRLGPGGVSGPQ